MFSHDLPEEMLEEISQSLSWSNVTSVRLSCTFFYNSPILKKRQQDASKDWLVVEHQNPFLIRQGIVFDCNVNLATLAHSFTPFKMDAKILLQWELSTNNGYKPFVLDCANQFTILKDGSVLAKGANLNGSLGLGHLNPNQEGKVKGLPENVLVKKIVGHSGGTMFIMQNNECYYAGNRTDGFIRSFVAGEKNYITVATKFQVTFPVKDALLSHCGVWLLNEEGSLYEEAEGNFSTSGQKAPKDVSDLYCSYDRTVMLRSSSNRFYYHIRGQFVDFTDALNEEFNATRPK